MTMISDVLVSCNKEDVHGKQQQLETSRVAASSSMLSFNEKVLLSPPPTPFVRSTTKKGDEETTTTIEDASCIDAAFTKLDYLSMLSQQCETELLKEPPVPNVPPAISGHVRMDHSFQLLASCVDFLQAADKKMHALLGDVRQISVEVSTEGSVVNGGGGGGGGGPLGTTEYAGAGQTAPRKASLATSPLLSWLPSFISSVQKDISITLRHVFLTVNRLTIAGAFALPLPLQFSIKKALLSLPIKWTSLSLQLSSWSLHGSVSTANTQLGILVDLLMDILHVFASVKNTLLGYLGSLTTALTAPSVLRKEQPMSSCSSSSLSSSASSSSSSLLSPSSSSSSLLSSSSPSVADAQLFQASFKFP